MATLTNLSNTAIDMDRQQRLLLSMYDSALNSLEDAGTQIRKKNYAAKGRAISRVLAILNELSRSLSDSMEERLAANLNTLYILCMTKLLQASAKMDTQYLEPVETVLVRLRDACGATRHEQPTPRKRTRARILPFSGSPVSPA